MELCLFFRIIGNHCHDLYFNILFMLMPKIDNGFFAAWLGCLCSLNLMVIQMKDGAPGNFV